MPAPDYKAYYPGTVAAQNADGTLEIVSDDDRFDQFSDVPIKAGIPGVAIKIAPNAKILFGFEGGDPSAVYVSTFGIGTVLKLSFAEGTDGQAAARKSDAVSVTLPSGTV